MNDIRKKEFFELMEEVKTIAENLNTVVLSRCTILRRVSECTLLPFRAIV